MTGSTFYLVQRAVGGGPSWYHDEHNPHPSGVPVRLFAREEDAVAHKNELEARARREVYPFSTYNVSDNVTRLSEKQVIDRLIKLGVKPPQSEKHYNYRDWTKWWSRVGDEVTQEQLDAIWTLLDRLEYYSIVEVQLAD